MIERYRYLDGLRGVAAVVVVFEHLSAFLPIGYWQVGSGITGDIVSSIIDAPFRSGTFSVDVFFIISGFVITGSAQKRPSWPAILWRRYLRLTVPMVFASLVAAALFQFFPNLMPEVYEVFPNHWSKFHTLSPSFFAALSEGFWGEYLFAKHDINPVIWSMRVELIGSLALYTFYRFIPSKLAVPLMSIGACICGIYSSSYLCFPLGALLYEAKTRDRIRSSGGALGILMVMLGVACGVFGILHRPRVFFPMGALLIVGGIMASGAMQALLAKKTPQFLGRISYSLYLLHLPILFSVFAALYLWLGVQDGVFLKAVWLAAVVPTLLVAALAMTRWIDEPIARLVRAKPARQV